MAISSSIEWLNSVNNHIKTAPDIILMDITMRDMKCVLNSIKSNQTTCEITIIFIRDVSCIG